jgi:hypothetical protein
MPIKANKQSFASTQAVNKKPAAQSDKPSTADPERGSGFVPFSAAQVIQMQRTHGNAVVLRMLAASHPPAAVQRDHRDDLSQDFNASVLHGFWQLAAEELNGFNNEDIQARVQKLSFTQLRDLKIGALRRMPGWSDRVTKPIDSLNPEAGRIGQLIFDYNSAVGARQWDRAAVLLNGFNDEDILIRLQLLEKAELPDLRQAALTAMPGWSQRVVGPIDILINRYTVPVSGPGKGPVKVAAGPDAVKGLSMLKNSAGPVMVNGGAMGDVQLVPGATYQDKILVSVTPLTVYYIDGIDLYEAYTPDFVRDFWLRGFLQGVKNAEWLLPIIKAEMALIQAFIAPWYVMLGIGILKGLVFYFDNKEAIHLAAKHFSAVNAARNEIKKRYPVMYDALFWEGLESALVHMPEGVEAEDVAYLIGRIIGFQGLLGEVEAGVAITLKIVIKVVLEYAILVTALHAPMIIAHGVEHALETEGKKLKERMAAKGVNISEDQGRKIAKEIYEDSGGKDSLENLQRDAESLQKSIIKLQAEAKKNF